MAQTSSVLHVQNRNVCVAIRRKAGNGYANRGKLQALPQSVAARQGIAPLAETNVHAARRLIMLGTEAEQYALSHHVCTGS